MANEGWLVLIGTGEIWVSFMTLRNTLQDSLESVPDGIAVGYIDLATGSLISLAAREERPQEFLNVIARAVTEMFEAPLFRVLDKIWAQDFSEEALQADAFTEILLIGTDYTTLLKRCEKNPRHAVIYVTRKNAPPGVLMMQVRSNLPLVEAAV
jgi:hypothetical protein